MELSSVNGVYFFGLEILVEKDGKFYPGETRLSYMSSSDQTEQQSLSLPGLTAGVFFIRSISVWDTKNRFCKGLPELTQV